MAIPDDPTLMLPVLQSGAAPVLFLLILLIVGLPLGYLLKASSQGECHVCRRKFTVASYQLVCFGRHRLHAQCAVRDGFMLKCPIRGSRTLDG